MKKIKKKRRVDDLNLVESDVIFFSVCVWEINIFPTLTQSA